VERAGGLPSLKLLDYLEQRGLSFGEGVRLLSHEGGLFSHFGLRDITEMTAMSQDSPQKRAVLDAYVYQIAKGVSSFLPLFSGAVDAVVFTGGAVHSAAIRKALEEKLSFVGRLLWYPGEFEMDALAEGVRSALLGREIIREY